MISKTYRLGSLEEPIYTLAQSGTAKKQTLFTKPEITVNGNGTELQNNLETLQNWAKRKTITQKLILSLIDVSDKKGNFDRKKNYWNTYHCLNRVYLFDGKFYGKYCKNRICTLCSSIRKAELINKYLPIISKWQDPHFTTLTAQAVPAKKLNARVKNMLRAMRKIIDRYRKNHQRGKSIKLIGIRSLECNFNPITRTYNPHLHLILPSKEIAETIQLEWLNLWTSKYTYKGAQKTRKVTDTERDLIEIIKYGTKIFTDPTMKNNKTANVTPYVYASALDNILYSMKNIRIFERFGFDCNSHKKQSDSKTKTLKNYNKLQFNAKYADWIDEESERILTGYKIPPSLALILENNINKVME